MKNSTLLMSKTIIIFLLFLHQSAFSQKIAFSENHSTYFALESMTAGTLSVNAAINEISFTKQSSPMGYFAVPQVAGYMQDNKTGYPALPVMRKIIEVPVNAEVTFKITSVTEKEYYLPDYHILFPLYPAQRSVSKSEDAQNKPFDYNAASYTKNSFQEQQILSFTESGFMRGCRLGVLSFHPVDYNPVTQTIKVITNIQFEVAFEHADQAATEQLKARTCSPYFSGTYEKFVFNHQPELKSNLTQYPVSYVIVSDIMFQSALQPFIQWKTQKGFKVIEAYTNNPSVGNTTTSIKSYLQNLYNSATPGNPAFSFVLLVGDVAQVPSFTGTTGGHLSDLYYCEYTGDKIPEVYYGRFSATNVNELQPQIDKTLQYEKYQLGDPAFLNEVVLVAGVDAGMAPIHGNGHINYIGDTYVNTSAGFTPHAYPYPASGSSAAQIIQNVSNGVGYANYTAHCSSSGWADPSFSTSDVAGLQNNNKYAFMIGNCCSSNDFSTGACFGEALLRAANKGAIGYIGGSNSTYWDEDFWWGVGFKTAVLNPVYDANSLGAVDRMFHTHGEAFPEWFVTQGQINIAGNLAVQQSTNTSADYYWEIYHLMGDPSLMPYFKVPLPLTISYSPVILIGASSFAITTEPYTYVALSQNGTLLGAGLTDAGGIINLSITTITTPGTIDVVATRQNRQPHISTITAIVPNGPYVIYNNHAVNDAAGNNNGEADYGENIILNMTLKNVGNQTANAVQAKLKSASAFVNITDSTHTFGNIAADATANQNNAFAFTVGNLVPDQAIVAFTLECRDVNDSLWLSYFTVTLKAPLLAANPFLLDDLGNSDGILDPNETANLTIPTYNNGHATAVNTTGSLQSLSNLLVVNNATDALGNIAPTQFADAVFSIKADSLASPGTLVKLVYTATAAPYSIIDTISIVLGEIPEINMKDTTVTTCIAYFFDSGGPSGNYANDEIKTITFLPTVNTDNIKVTFTEFEVEENVSAGSCWDELKVYNGNSTSAPLLGTFCGTNLPGPFEADNPDGALTFRFTSDYSVSKNGWSAEVMCVTPVGTKQLNQNVSFNLFPNPAENQVQIQLEGFGSAICYLGISNIQGVQVMGTALTAETSVHHIDISGLAKGVYLVKLTATDKQIVKKLLIY